MRIAITMQSHDEAWGGIGVYTRQIVENLLAMDRQNQYLLVYPPFGNAQKGLGQYQSRYPNCVEVKTGRSVPWGIFWEQLVLPRFLRQHRIDLLFNPFWSAPLVGRYKKVLAVHGLDSHVTPEALTWRGRFEWALHSRVWVHRADAVVAISDMMSRDLQKYDRLSESRIRRIHHGRSESFRPIEDAEQLRSARERYGLPGKFILFVGMLFPQKNFSNLLHAFARLAPDIPHQLVVVGRPRWKFRGELDLIGKLGLTHRVQIIDHVAHEELAFVYNLADCFVFPSLYEAFGLVGLEAMACGCPVAASETGALPEVLGEGALYFDPLQPEQMADRIRQILERPQLRAELVRQGLERAASFTWQKAAREVLKLFSDVHQGNTVRLVAPDTAATARTTALVRASSRAARIGAQVRQP